MEKCLQYQMPNHPSLVLVEYAQNIENENDALALERMLRRVLRLKSMPAVVLVNIPRWKDAKSGHIMLDGSMDQRQIRASRLSPESGWIHALASHYRIPSVSLHRLLLQLSRPDRNSTAVNQLTGRIRNVNVTAGWFQCSLVC